MRRLVAFVSVSIALWGCRPIITTYPAVEPRYYVATYDTKRSTEGGVLPRQSDVLAQDAAKQLAAGKTVAFLPPDSCATTNVAPSGAQQGSTSILMECGALLASLEAEVAKAGYSVVSWQALKSTGSAASQERARALNVDILFEVNQLSQDPRDPGARQLANMSFSMVQMPTSATSAASVTRDVAARCAGLVPKLRRGQEKEFTSTINLKAVDVKSGRALWLYQNSVVEIVGEDGLAQQMLYFSAGGTRPEPPPPRVPGLQIAGGASLGFGLLFGFLGGLILGVGGDSGEDPATLLLVSGAVMTVGGIVMLVVGADGKSNEPVPEPTYSAAAEVLCVGNPVTFADSGGAAAAVPTGEENSASYSYTQTASADRDLGRERGQRLAQKITADFVGALKAVAQGH